MLSRDDLRQLVQKSWGDEKPIFVFCPLCDEILETNGYGPFSSKICPKGHYVFQSQGSYASRVTINVTGKEERFWLDDMFDDSEKMHDRIKEIKEKKMMSDLELLKQNKPDVAVFLEQWRSKYERTFDLKDVADQANFYEGVVEMARHMAVAAHAGTVQVTASNEGATGLIIKLADPS
jgi:hypothetical protein